MLQTPTSVHFYPEERGRGAKPPTAQLWGPEIDLERRKIIPQTSLRGLCICSHRQILPALTRVDAVGMRDVLRSERAVLAKDFWCIFPSVRFRNVPNPS